jgi:hypothetical protein
MIYLEIQKLVTSIFPSRCELEGSHGCQLSLLPPQPRLRKAPTFRDSCLPPRLGLTAEVRHLMHRHTTVAALLRHLPCLHLPFHPCLSLDSHVVYHLSRNGSCLLVPLSLRHASRNVNNPASAIINSNLEIAPYVVLVRLFLPPMGECVFARTQPNQASDRQDHPV